MPSRQEEGRQAGSDDPLQPLPQKLHPVASPSLELSHCSEQCRGLGLAEAAAKYCRISAEQQDSPAQ